MDLTNPGAGVGAPPPLAPVPVATAAGPAQAPAARTGLVLAVLCVAAFMASLDVFIVNVAFPQIGVAFHGPSLADLSWVLNAYAIAYAALLVPLGRLSDRYGRKAGFLAGLALFVVGSAACAVSANLWTLVAFRVLQAVGAAALTPTSLGLLLAATPAQRRVRAVRIWAASGALAAAAGPVVGGLLIEASWRWVFLVNVPVGAVALVIALRRVPDSRDTAVTRIPDLLGALLLAAAIGAVALALVKGPDWGWTGAATLGWLAAGALGLAGFWWRALHHPSPVVEPALLRVRAFAWSNATALLFSVAFGGGLLAVILWLQDVWGYSALRTGLAVAPGPLMVPVFAAISQRVHQRVPAGWMAAAGCALFGAGAVLLAYSVGARPEYAAAVLPGWLVMGVGVGLALPTILSSATADLPPARAATGSGVVNMSRQIGLVLGVSILTAAVGGGAAHAGGAAAFDAVRASFRHGWWAVVIAAVIGTLTAFGMTPRGSERSTAA